MERLVPLLDSAYDAERPGGTAAKALDLVGASLPLRVALRGVGLKPIHLAMLGFGLYWVVPLTLAAASGSLLDPAVASRELGGLGLGGAARWFSRAEGVSIPYLTDFVHLGMSVVTPLIGGTLAMMALVQYRGVLQGMLDRDLFAAPAEEVERTLAWGARTLRSRGIRLALAVVATVLAWFMASRSVDPTYAGWWGHRSHGLAGLAFAAAVWAMVFFGGLYLFFLAVGLETVSRLLRYPVRVQPLHPDECNGFGDFGSYLILMAGLALSLAGALWVTFWGGYLGVERFVTTWLGGLFCIIVLPFIVILPLARLTRQIAAARDQRTEPVIRALHGRLETLEAGFQHQGPAETVPLSRSLRDLARTHQALGRLYPSNVFPFKPKIAGTLSAGYVVQVVLFVRRALENFGP